MAVTLNSYAIPATTSFTAYVFSGSHVRETIATKHQRCCLYAIRFNHSRTETQTFDELVHGIDNSPEVTSLLALLQNIAQDTRTPSVTWCIPRNADAVDKGADHLWRCWRAWKSWSMQKQNKGRSQRVWTFLLQSEIILCFVATQQYYADEV